MGFDLSLPFLPVKSSENSLLPSVFSVNTMFLGLVKTAALRNEVGTKQNRRCGWRHTRQLGVEVSATGDRTGAEMRRMGIVVHGRGSEKEHSREDQVRDHGETKTDG